MSEAKQRITEIRARIRPRDLPDDRANKDDIPFLLALNKQLVEALKAAKSILWMAKEYAEAGGSGGIEVNDYEEIEVQIDAALRAAGE